MARPHAVAMTLAATMALVFAGLVFLVVQTTRNPLAAAAAVGKSVV